ncbi:DUF6584 family protein [Rhodococcus sp. 14-2470-1a]|uniref:DUF6584 family protein n=1 Tax=Rhodococcus sp. 14-2470-1a TaxID=2023150 RepID=UPI000B9A30FB|nr:DUF6584 family protein [Rhodococcus sp. 14-2470-1a]OZF41877.1 hypothetical protein CH292_27080 [Rhodococcus sp. 14-2470-1a]
MDVIDSAQRALAAGDLDGARERLYEALRTAPASQPVLELLAYTHLLRGDRASAGAAWFLTDKADDDPTASSAFEALAARHRSALELAKSLPINAPSRYYPERARARLDRLVTAIAAGGQEWVPPRDTVYFDEAGVDVDDFVDDEFSDGSVTRSDRPLRQRVLATLVIVAIAATSASVVLAIVFS